MTIRGGLVVGILTSVLFMGSANAQGMVLIEKISFKVVDAFEPGAAVSGELRIPDSKHDRLPAVLILHSSPGFDGRGAFYAEALNQAGIATLEIDYLQGRGIPATPRHNMPHAYETLQYLAGHPRIDPMRIGIMGFSWGGIISVLTSSEELTGQYTCGKLRFAAHLGLYPLCWRHRAVLAGTDKHFSPLPTSGLPVRRSISLRATWTTTTIPTAARISWRNCPPRCAPISLLPSTPAPRLGGIAGLAAHRTILAGKRARGG